MTVLILLPRDGLFLKDGREWATSQEGRAHSLGWPMPSTLLGALVTARGRLQEVAGPILASNDWQALANNTILQPSIALRRPVCSLHWEAADRVWPVPADAVFLGDNESGRTVLRLDPRKADFPVLGRHDDPALRALWWPALDDQRKPAQPPQWWAESAFIDWLADPATERKCAGDYRGIAQPRRFQAHVGIDPQSLAARETILFAHDVVETLDAERCEWAIGCQADLGDDRPQSVTLGGDRRLADIEMAADDLFTIPDTLRTAFEQRRLPGLRLVAVTPAAFGAGWCPDEFVPDPGGVCRGTLPGIDGELILRAAFVPRPTQVSGWDMAQRRPKPTTRLVPRGAVYHLVRAEGGSFSAADAERLWLVALGNRTKEGFGRFVPGVWHPEVTE